MADAKFKRYAAYAIGETALVVMGILIALQVNNWNMDRLERKKEMGILQDLKVEFIANQKDAIRVLEGHKGIVHAMNSIQDLSKETMADDLNLTIDSLMYALFDWFTFTPKPGASNGLVNSGGLNIISDKNLRDRITLWKGVVDDLIDDEDLAHQYSQNTILPFLAANYPIENLENLDYNVSNDSTKKLDPTLTKNVEPKAYDYRQLMADQQFLSHVSTKKLLARHNILECEVVVATIDSILSDIDHNLSD